MTSTPSYPRRAAVSNADAVDSGYTDAVDSAIETGGTSTGRVMPTYPSSRAVEELHLLAAPMDRSRSCPSRQRPSLPRRLQHRPAAAGLVLLTLPADLPVGAMTCQPASAPNGQDRHGAAAVARMVRPSLAPRLQAVPSA